MQLHVERLAKQVRRKRADAEKAAAEAQHTAGAAPGPAKGNSTSKPDVCAAVKLENTCRGLFAQSDSSTLSTVLYKSLACIA